MLEYRLRAQRITAISRAADNRYVRGECVQRNAAYARRYTF